MNKLGIAIGVGLAVLGVKLLTDNVEGLNKVRKKVDRKLYKALSTRKPSKKVRKKEQDYDEQEIFFI